MLKKISVVMYLGIFIVLAMMAASGLCQSQASDKPAETNITSKSSSYAAEIPSAVTPPTTPTANTVSAVVPLPIAKAESSTKPTSETATFNRSITLDPTNLTSMTIYVLNTPPVNQGKATINISGTDQPIYINSNVQTITIEDTGFSTWFSGTYTSISVYNHDTNNEWNPQTFYITWQ